VLFFAPTAEEKGLLGARYYVNNPLYPLSRTAAVLNMDGCNPWGRTADIEIVGAGQSTLEELLKDAAGAQNRKVVPQSNPERGSFFRSDHFEFVKAGIPALYFRAGKAFIGKPSDFGTRKTEEYVRQHYHKPSDAVSPDWDLSGAIEDLRLMFMVGWRVAEEKDRPTWKPTSEFRPGSQVRSVPRS
jgi:Zn-dependent M28 family amino/carboxypeptidase